MGMGIIRYLEEQTLIQTGLVSRDFLRYLTKHVVAPEELVRPKTPEAYETFDRLVHTHFFTPDILSIKIYDTQGTLVYHSEARNLVGRVFSGNLNLQKALQGEVVGHFSTLHGHEHLYERQTNHKRLQEIYMPITAGNDDHIIGVFELYIVPTPLFNSISKMKILVWSLIILGLFGLNGNLYWIIRDASKSLARQKEIFRRNQELATLNAVGAVVNESLQLDEILTRALDKVLEVTKAESGEIFLWNEESQELVLRKFQGLLPEAFEEMTRFKLNEGCIGVIAQTGKPIVVRDLPEDRRFLRERVKQAGFRSFAGVPLRSKGKVVGVMDIASLDAQRLTSEDVDLLAALGNQIGVAIENARLYEQLKEMSVLEERQRIAREMHDGLAQELGYLHLKIGELADSPLSQSTPPLREDLQLMKKVTSRAYEEVREAIFGLKMVSRSLGLIPSLTEYLHTFGEQSGLTVELQILNEEAIRLSPHAEVHVIRIIQEALANARKHAQAKHTWVAFETAGEEVKVTIEDDGRGFGPEDVTRLGRPSFGLQGRELNRWAAR
jgi:signal transduction histidine kinase